MLIHLSDDVKNLGSLDENSAFQFENYMQVFKKQVRSGKCPLTQIINRIDEHVRFNNIVSKKISKINIKYPNNIYLYKDSFCKVIKSNGDNNYTCLLYQDVTHLYNIEEFTSDIIGCYIFHSNNTIRLFLTSTDLII